MRALAACLLLLLVAPLCADADGDYAALLASFKAKEWTKTLDQAEAFVKAHPDFKHTHAARYMGANAALNAEQYERGETLYRDLLAKHPTSSHADKTRSELVTLLSNARKLDACVTQCEENLKARPETPGVEYWRVMTGECRFRLWQFKQAETDLRAFLKDYPESRFRGRAESSLRGINPPLKLGANGVVEGYAGKYVDDARFHRALKALPAHFVEAWKVLRETLGVDLAGKAVVAIEFKDKGFVRDTERAIAETISLDYKPVTLITFYTEHVVVHEEDFKSRVIHELKHAAFRGVMGQGYLNLPKWVREGLAVYGARQTEDRAYALMSNEAFAGQEPRRVLDGIDDPDHDVSDYIEDAMAFVWLEARKKGAVHTFCKRLCAGEAYDKLYSELAGMEYALALKAAADSIKADFDKRLGSAEAELKSIQAAQGAAQGRGQEAKWATDTGIAKYAAWLKANPGHLLESVARYRMARAMVAANQHEDARREFAVVAADELRCTLTDDARYWIARSFELEGKAEQAEAAYGVLLRDFSWSSYAVKLKDTRKAAGPVKE